MHAHAPLAAPSDWITRWSGLLTPGTKVLDVACARGRHVRWFVQRGHPVVGVDRDADALCSLDDLSGSHVELVQADIEQGPWPLAGRRFGAVVVTNYLWRPLLPTLVESVDEGGVLLYETFASGQETVGRPSRPDFLLQPGELLSAVAGQLRVVSYEDGFLEEPRRFVQRIVAVRVLPGQAAAFPLATPPGSRPADR